MNFSQPNPIDSVAVKILFRKYWSPQGWIKGEIVPSELEYAKLAGVMFEPLDSTHHQSVSRALAMRERIHPDAVANAFLSSLSSRRMDLRSALGSYSAILRLEPHPYTQARGRIDCATCGDYLESRQTDISILNFERLKWGGVRHTQPLYAGLDLEWFSSLQVPEATQEDRSCLRQLLDRVSTLSPHGRPNDLEKAIKGIFASNQSERRTVIDILGLSGVLVPMGLPNFFSTYPKSAERKQPDNKNDWNYPVLWWRGSDGINEEALRFWFPNL